MSASLYYFVILLEIYVLNCVFTILGTTSLLSQGLGSGSGVSSQDYDSTRKGLFSRVVDSGVLVGSGYIFQRRSDTDPGCT